MKNPFKKSSIIDTVVNVGVGGAANVAVDYVVNATGVLDGVTKADTILNAAKIAVGALAGTMIKNKIARAAADGVAVVGASNLVSSLVAGETSTDATSGLPFGTIGKVRLGNRNFRRGGVRGVNATPNAFMGK